MPNLDLVREIEFFNINKNRNTIMRKHIVPNNRKVVVKKIFVLN